MYVWVGMVASSLVSEEQHNYGRATEPPRAASHAPRSPRAASGATAPTRPSGALSGPPGPPGPPL